MRKRIDIGCLWIMNNYLNLKKSNKLNNLKCGNLNQQEIKKYQLDYDRTLYTILFSLQSRQEPGDRLLIYIHNIKKYIRIIFKIFNTFFFKIIFKNNLSGTFTH